MMDPIPVEQLVTDPEYRLRVEKIARKYTGNIPSLAWEDVAQAAHEKVVHAIRSGKVQYQTVEKLYSWAATVAHHEISDIVKREQNFRQRFSCWSLDQVIPGTEVMLSETIADPSINLLTQMETQEQITQMAEIVYKLDQLYPDRCYLRLFQIKCSPESKTQAQIAEELNLTQSAVSKRLRELSALLAQELDILNMSLIQQEKWILHQQKRSRSLQQWEC
jgi:RNA polymerase sigma factor (sigma-70 family)